MPRAWVTRAMSSIRAEEVLNSKLNAALASLQTLRSHLNYSCDVGKLDLGLQKCFVELSCNQRTFDFLQGHRPHTMMGAWARHAAGLVMSNTDANTMLGMYKMHVLDTENARIFLDGVEHASPRSRGSLLDVGAGDGNVTVELKDLFDQVLATEVSLPAIWRLRENNIPCMKIGSLNPLAGREFDTVACLNVLDRCSHPLSLLRTMRGLMRPATGRLLLAVVFPFHPCVEVGWGRKLVKPVEDLGMDPEAGWEMSVNQMVEKVLRPAGFEVVRLSRVPYLCQGDVSSPFYELDDAIFLLRSRVDDPGQ